MFVVMPFGLNVAPGCFTKVLKTAIATLRPMAIRLVIWLEGILMISSSKDTCVKHAKIIITLLQTLGFVINFAKSVLVPTQELEFLGMIVTNIKFLSSQRKIVAVRQKAFGLIRNRNSVSVREVCQFIGMCNATQLAAAEAPLHYKSIQHCMIWQMKQFNLPKNRIYSNQIVL